MIIWNQPTKLPRASYSSIYCWEEFDGAHWYFKESGKCQWAFCLTQKGVLPPAVFRHQKSNTFLNSLSEWDILWTCGPKVEVS